MQQRHAYLLEREVLCPPEFWVEHVSVHVVFRRLLENLPKRLGAEPAEHGRERRVEHGGAFSSAAVCRCGSRRPS